MEKGSDGFISRCRLEAIAGIVLAQPKPFRLCTVCRLLSGVHAACGTAGHCAAYPRSLSPPTWAPFSP